MGINKIFVTLSGLASIAFILWFFFGKKEEEAVAQEAIDIIVDGGYKPARIKVKKGKTTILRITRKDPNNCLEEIILSELKIKKFLPLNKLVEIPITPEKEGEYRFHCGMNMYHGTIIVS